MSAQISWEGLVPYSTTYGDIFFNPKNGRQESEHVFIKGNNIIDRFSEEKGVVIAELGLGSTLNLALTLYHKKQINKKTPLWYIACEKHPWTKKDIKKALSPWKDLSNIASYYTPHLPPLYAGFFLIQIPEINTQILILQGDAQKNLEELDAQIDAWYLDGFNPKVKDGLWEKPLFNQINRLSHNQTTLATYSCSRVVKNLFLEQGVYPQKRKGCLGKREVLYGVFSKHPVTKTKKERVSIRIEGMGIAGSSVARSAQRRGLFVQINDKEDQIATKASSNPLGLFHSKIKPNYSGHSQLSLQGKCFTEQLLKNMDASIYQKAPIIFSGENHNRIAGFSENQLGGMVDIKELCVHLLRDIDRGGEKNTKPTHTVLCHGAEYMHPQFTTHTGALLTIDYKEPHKINTILINDFGYCLPQNPYTLVIGSTYDKKQRLPEDLIKELLKKAHQFGVDREISRYNLWQGNRVVSKNKLPKIIREKHNTWVLNGLGSKSLLYAPLLAEQIVSEILGEPQPIMKSVQKLIRG